VTFEKQTLTERFVAEGCAVADFDKDGHADITAGNTIWHGPDFSRTTEFTPPANNPSGPSKTPYDPARGYSDSFLAYAHDFTGDGWPEILVYGLPGEPAHVFVNPQGRASHWEKHAIFDVADGESPGLVDMTGDGKPELLAHSSDLVKPPEANGMRGGQLGFAEIDWNHPLAKARFHPITPRSPENRPEVLPLHAWLWGRRRQRRRPYGLTDEGRLVRAAGRHCGCDLALPSGPVRSARRPRRRADARH
jgi:hypothetical protein